MPDLENRLPELLHHAAVGAPADGRIERTVLRRARRRRVLNASAAGLAAIALIAGAVLGARELVLSNRTTPADQSPSPSQGTEILVWALPGAVWPEVDEGSLEDAQARADAGELGWRLDPVQTATSFATEVLGWDPADVRIDLAEWATGGGAARVVAEISNAGLGPAEGTAGPAAPKTLVTLRQLGQTGDSGVWTVVGADSDLIAIDPLPGSAAPGSTIEVHAPVAEVRAEWVGTLALISIDATDGTVRIFPGDVTETIAGSVRVPDDAHANVAVVARLSDPEGTTVAVDIVPIAVDGSTLPIPSGATGPSGTSGPSGPTGPIGPGQEIPSAVLATRDLIAIAAETRDFDALEALIDPDHFAYNFDDGSNPVPEWRRHPAVLDTLATILRLPFTTTEGTPDVGTIYVWPSLADADLTNPTADEQAMLETLGITDTDVQGMLEAFGGYAGPRTGIAEDGTWLFYTVGGD